MSAASGDRRGLWRSRWAAIGAAVAVTFGAGGLFAVNAASPESSTVAIAPVRILDTRSDVGLPGPFVSAVAQDLKVTGSVPTAGGGSQVVVPAGSTGVFLNVTPVGSTAAGFISVRPANATGAPTTSNVNFTAGAINPNGVLVELPVGGADDGKIEITFDAFGAAGPTTEVLVDVVGYTTDGRLKAIETALAGKANSADVGAGFVTNSAGNLLAFTGGSADQTVATLNLPAGKFIVNASVTANNNSISVNNVGCDLFLGAVKISSLFSTTGFPLAPDSGGAERESISLNGAGTLAAPGTATVVCRANINSGNWLARTITAVQVSTLTGSGVAPLEEPGTTDSSED